MEAVTLVETVGSANQGAASPPDAAADRALHPVLQSTAALRQLTGCGSASDAMAAFLEAADAQQSLAVLTEHDCLTLITAAFDRGNIDLAKSIYETMGRTNSAATSVNIQATLASPDGANWGWPPATLRATELMVLLFARELRVQDALDVVARIRSRGMPSVAEVPFGVVVSSPLAPDKPLTVVQPQEGKKLVACPTSRYEYELFSGSVAGEPKSEALNAGQSLLSRLLRRDVCQAVHELLVRSPDGDSWTFRVGTASASVPAQVGERITVIASPAADAPLRKGGLLTSRPPGVKAGEPLVVVNHSLGTTTQVMRPPARATQSLPKWALPVLISLVAGDAGTGILDPNYPLLIAAAVAAVGVSAVSGNQFLLPRLKQLPEKSMAVEEVQQQLLEAHSALMRKARGLNDVTKDNVRALARLWQLQVKMASVGTAYDARLARVVQARSRLEEQLCKRLALLEGYCRVGSMIEIEVEMSSEVPQSEIDDIESQIRDLSDVEAMQQEWELQAEAQDELERLLKST